MTPRRLSMEPLEPRLHASAWPAGIGVAADVFIDGGAHLSQKSLSAVTGAMGLTTETLLTSSHAKTRAVIGGSPNDTNGALLYPDGDNRVTTVFVNGGSATNHGLALGKVGRDRFAEFFAAGGSYTGSCAGAWFAETGKNYSNIWDGQMKNSGGTGYQTVSFADEDAEHPILQYLREHGVDPASPITGIRHIGGPKFSESYRHPEGTEFIGTVVASTVRSTRNTPFIIAYKADENSGRMVIQPSHTEYKTSGPQFVLMQAIVSYAIDGAQNTPGLKASITIEDATSVIDMTGPTQKIGDGQYHRFEITAPAGLTQLRIGITGLSADADLYVNHETYAHAEDYAAKSSQPGTANEDITLDSPEPGVWHVSVFGNHEVLNGAAYTLVVTPTFAEV